MKLLFVIPARGGSIGIPNKNTKPLNGVPLVHYSIRYARLFTEDEHICVSTDSEEIIHCANQICLSVPFLRPLHLASDEAGTYEVLIHALNYYSNNNKHYDAL